MARAVRRSSCASSSAPASNWSLAAPCRKPLRPRGDSIRSSDLAMAASISSRSPLAVSGADPLPVPRRVAGILFDEAADLGDRLVEPAGLHVEIHDVVVGQGERGIQIDRLLERLERCRAGPPGPPRRGTGPLPGRTRLPSRRETGARSRRTSTRPRAGLPLTSSSNASTSLRSFCDSFTSPSRSLCSTSPGPCRRSRAPSS